MLISGRGLNLQAIIDAVQTVASDATLAVVVSTAPIAAGLARARHAGIEAHPSQSARPCGPSRLRFRHPRRALRRDIRSDLVCLAGFMRLVGLAAARRVSESHPQHPSVIAAGVSADLDAQRQALEHGVRVSARHGAISSWKSSTPARSCFRPLCRYSRPIRSRRSRRAILVEEHRIYPEAIGLVLDGEWRIDGRKLVARTEGYAGWSVSGDLGRTIHAHRQVDRSNPSAHEDRRLLAMADSRDDRKLLRRHSAHHRQDDLSPCV